MKYNRSKLVELLTIRTGCPKIKAKKFLYDFVGAVNIKLHNGVNVNLFSICEINIYQGTKALSISSAGICAELSSPYYSNIDALTFERELQDIIIELLRERKRVVITGLCSLYINKRNRVASESSSELRDYFIDRKIRIRMNPITKDILNGYLEEAIC